MTFAELLVILIVALLAFGPKQLPQLAKQLGKFVAVIKSFYERYRKELEQQVKLTELKNNIERAEMAENRKAEKNQNTD